MSARASSALGNFDTKFAIGTGARLCGGTDPIATACDCAGDGCNGFDATGASSCGPSPSVSRSSACRFEAGTNDGQSASIFPRTNEIVCSNDYGATNANMNAHDANGLGGCGTGCASDTDARRCA